VDPPTFHDLNTMFFPNESTSPNTTHIMKYEYAFLILSLKVRSSARADQDCYAGYVAPVFSYPLVIVFHLYLLISSPVIPANVVNSNYSLYHILLSVTEVAS
jgi:hypothetical protein